MNKNEYSTNTDGILLYKYFRAVKKVSSNTKKSNIKITRIPMGFKGRDIIHNITYLKVNLIGKLTVHACTVA